MGTWVCCPNCLKNLPRKYKSKSERKELHTATCKNCLSKDARKSFELGVKRGIWLKKWSKANENFLKAANEFSMAGQTDNRLTAELMAYMCALQDTKSKNTAINVFQRIISGEYDKFLNKNFIIPEFVAFDPLYYESKGWDKFFKIQNIAQIFDKIQYMKETSREFFKMGYDYSYFSTYILNEKKINIDIALRIEAEAEEYLGGYYTSIDDIEKASNHLSNAISAYTSLMDMGKARQLKMIRQSMRMETACWVCGTRSKGHGIRFSYKYTGLNETDYVKIINQLKQRQERNPTIYDDTLYTTEKPIDTIDNKDVKGKRGLYFSICRSCQGLIDNLAQSIVDKALVPVWNSIKKLQSDMMLVNNRLSAIEARLKVFKAV